MPPAPTNLHCKKEVVMKHPATKQAALKCAAVLALLIAGSAAQATDYNYSETYAPVGKAARTDAQLQSDTAACDGMIGVQSGGPSASYRACMLQHGWRFTHLERSKAPADPYFSSNAKVAPGHFIDHDNGMDCVNTGGAEVCDPPNGTVHYFDPDQGLPCTRTGAMSVCSNM
jgi:hypothetical protein